MSEGTIAAPASPQVSGSDSLPRILIIDSALLVNQGEL